MKERYLNREHLFMIHTDFQTEGRGQHGNGWESERGKNLLFSTLIQRPPIRVDEQFRLSMWISVCLVQSLKQVTGLSDYRIKWPNDIYLGDKKLAGILIESSLQAGEITYAIVGVGLNVNQEVWLGDAPNPTSLKLETGKEWDREQLLQTISYQIKKIHIGDSDIDRLYQSKLFRRYGYHRYVECVVSSTPTMIARGGCEGEFDAEYVGITPMGELMLRLRSGEVRTYHFKQIRYVLQ